MKATKVSKTFKSISEYKSELFLYLEFPFLERQV